MIYTSYYSKAKKLGDNYIKLGISRFPPKNIINNYNLAPSVELFNDCKNNIITDREFILRYRDEVVWYLDEFIKAIQPFNNNNDNHIVLCCYERLGLCHRHILAEILRQRGINIMELQDIKDYKELYKLGKIINGLNGFRGKYECLSNFYELKQPIKVKLPFGNIIQKEYVFSNIESAFQSSKTLDINEIDKMVINCKTAGDFKKYGRKVTLRKDWEDIKLNIMEYLLFEKYKQCEEFRNTLNGIPEDMEIVEMNYWNDKYWGVCSKTFKGENNLGKLLMKIKNKEEL